jgi:ABC-type nitrate/sulfonate/bicarbonate transport system permease component
MPRRHSLQKYYWRLLTLLAALAGWQALASAHDNALLFPSLGQIALHSFPSIALFADSPTPSASALVALRVIAEHSALTILHITIGLAVGCVTGIAAAMAVHFFKRSTKSNRLILTGARTIPLLALIPLFIYWFGNQELGIYVYIAFGVFVVMSTITYDAISNVPREYVHQARLLGADRPRIFSTVYLRAIEPRLLPAFRDVVGLCWAFSLGAEFIATRAGLGYLVFLSYQYSDMGKLLIFAAIYVVYGYAAYLMTTAFTRRIGRWYLTEAGKDAI